MSAAYAAGRIRVLIVDDDRRFAELEATLLADDPRIEVVGFAADGEEAILQAGLLRPDLILMDVSMPGLDGIEATGCICARLPAVRVIVVTGSISAADVDRARCAGADAYIPKDRVVADLLDAVRQVSASEATSLARGISARHAAVDERRGTPSPHMTAWLPIPT
jgi:two-component system response regulator DesR